MQYKIKVKLAEPKITLETTRNNIKEEKPTTERSTRIENKTNNSERTTQDNKNKNKLTKQVRGRLVTDLKLFLETKKKERAEKLERETNLHNLPNNHTQQITHSAPGASSGEPSSSQTKPKWEKQSLPRD